MENKLRWRWRIEAMLAGVGTALFLLTLLLPEWIEVLTGLEPDSGSGSLEFAIAGAFLLAAVVLAVLARRNRQRLTALEQT